MTNVLPPKWLFKILEKIFEIKDKIQKKEKGHE